MTQSWMIEVCGCPARVWHAEGTGGGECRTCNEPIRTIEVIHLQSLLSEEAKGRAYDAHMHYQDHHPQSEDEWMGAILEAALNAADSLAERDRLERLEAETVEVEAEIERKRQEDGP